MRSGWRAAMSGSSSPSRSAQRSAELRMLSVATWRASMAGGWHTPGVPCAGPSRYPTLAGRAAHRARQEETRLLRLIPREERFFDLFVDDAANVLGGARLLEALLRTYDTVERRAGEIRDVEHRGDEISHDIG